MSESYIIRIDKQTVIVVPKNRCRDKEEYKREFIRKWNEGTQPESHIVNRREDITEDKLRQLLTDECKTQEEAARALHCSTMTIRTYARKFNIDCSRGRFYEDKREENGKR